MEVLDTLFRMLFTESSAVQLKGVHSLGLTWQRGKVAVIPDGHLESVPLLKQFSVEAGCAQGEIAQIQMLSSE